MRKLHSFLLFFIAIASFALAPSKARASHAAGGEIIYEWISDSTYRIYWKFYRDCTGIQENSTEALCIKNSCSSVPGSGTYTMNKWTGPLPGGYNNGDPVSAGCSQYKNTCDLTSSTIPGYREWWYYYLWTAGGKCDHWTFSVSISARNSSNNINGANLYVETTFDNSRFEGNSSPFFSVKPISYVCVNQPFSYNNGALDPDGDSLFSEMIRPLDGACGGSPTPIPWQSASPAFNITNNPLQTNNTFVLDGVTGQMTFVASQIGPSTVTTKVSEYSVDPASPNKGRLKGYIMRDIQVQVLQCSTKAPDFVQPTNAITGGKLINGVVNGCLGQPLDFDFYIKAKDTDAIMTAEDNHIYKLTTATVTYTNLKTDSIHGHFHWIPTQIGKTTFIVTAKDSTCKPPGIMLYYPQSFPIYIWGPISVSPDTSVCFGETAFLSVTGGSDYEWSVVRGGPITQLNCTLCANPVSTTIQPTTYLVTSHGTDFCPNNSDSVHVGILPGLNFTPVPDTVTCPNNSVVLNLHGMPPAGVTYYYKWDTQLYLDDSTKGNPTVTPKTDHQYIVTITNSANKCRSFDTVNVGVLTGFTMENADTAVCDGQVVNVRGTADPRYTINWTAASGSTNVFSPNNNVANPTISQAFAQPNDIYTMTLSHSNCRDTSASFKIEVQPMPNVHVDPDASMCFGDTMQLNGVVRDANNNIDTYKFYKYTWVPGSSLDKPNKLNPIFTANKQGANTLILNVTTPAGCAGSDTVTLTVFPAAFLFASNDTAICPGESARIHVSANGVKNFRWTPDVRIDDVYSLDPLVNPTVSQKYRVYAVDTNFCSDTAEVMVRVHSKAVLQLPDSVRIYPGESYQFQPGGNCSYYSWFPPLGLDKANVSNPIAQPEVNTRYFVTGVTEAGCTTSDSVTVFVSNESVIEMPNAFAPGSGPNGVLKVLHLGKATLKNFSVFNRWGVKVFETADLNQGWDGTWKNEPQPIGVYIYTVEAISETGRKFTKQGNVTLIR